MKKYIRILVFSFLILALVAGCAGQVDEPVAPALPEEAQQEEDTVNIPVEEPVEQAVDATITETPEEPGADQPPTITYTLSEQLYVSPSDAFSVNLPESWNCSETGDYRVDCYNADNSAVLFIRAIGTSYELLQDDFISLTQAEMVSTFENIKAYTEVAQEILEGTVINESTWREGEICWQGIDRFVRSGPAVYYLRIASTQNNFESYRELFDEVIQKAELNDSAMSSAPLYASRKEYVSRQLIFTMDVPTSWSEFVDAASIQNTVVSGFLSPDKRASVQVAIYSKGSHISQELKGTKTLEIMRDLYGWDLRATVDKVQPDGRELLEWYGTRKGINGITYFDSLNTYIYVFSVVWEDSTKDLYMPVLEEIIDSFAYYQ